MHDLGIADAAAAIRERRFSARELVQELLARIDRLEPELRAWVLLDREAGAHAEGPLAGVPIGVKDIFDVEGMPTAAGFAPYADRIASRDAPAVAGLRRAGAVILGKTVTTQFAYMDPPPTRNPWNADRTSGGSSSGSAAAVAARMVPGAVGSQTGGSVLRPAAYCGVVGLKPTHGLVSLDGVLPLSRTLDHPGPIARSVLDVALLLAAMVGEQAADYATAARRPEQPRLLVLDDFVSRAQPAARDAFEETVTNLTRAGAGLRRGAFPSGAATLISTHATVMQSEVGSVHRPILAEHADHYAPRIRAYIEAGLEIKAADYVDALQTRGRLAVQAEELLANVDCLVLPTVSGPAPAPDTTGDPTFQGPFSLLGLPAITLPSGLTPDGMPLGLQLVGRRMGEAALLSAAAWCEREMPGVVRERLATLVP